MAIVVETVMYIVYGLVVHDSHSLVVQNPALNFIINRRSEHEMHSAWLDENRQYKRVLRILNLFQVDEQCVAVARVLVNGLFAEVLNILVEKLLLELIFNFFNHLRSCLPLFGL